MGMVIMAGTSPACRRSTMGAILPVITRMQNSTAMTTKEPMIT